MLWTTFVASFIRNGRVTALLQPSEVDCLTSKHFNWQSFFFLILILIYFLRTLFGPREWACGLWINLLVYLFLSYLSHALLDFGETCNSLSLMHTLQVQLFSDLSYYLTLLQSILYTAE